MPITRKTLAAQNRQLTAMLEGANSPSRAELKRQLSSKCLKIQRLTDTLNNKTVYIDNMANEMLDMRDKIARLTKELDAAKAG